MQHHIVFATGGVFMNETELTKQERKHQEDLKRLQGFRPIDDTFMRGLLKDNMPLAEMILRILMFKPDLVLLKCITQADMKRVTGAKSICLDAYATDSMGKKYDIEVQRADDGADPHRARYHSSIMDIENLDAGQDCRMLPDTYIIFITENDYYEAGKPVYKIQNMNITLNEPFNDGAHIMYVNGTYRDDSDLGWLMHDFSCTNAEDMHFALLAEKTRYLKENPKGVNEMCKVMEDLRNESREEQAKETALRLSEMGNNIEDIAFAVNYSVDIVKQWLAHTAA